MTVPEVCHGTRHRIGLIVFLGICCAAVYALIVRMNDGTFTFALDDAYIHMVVARSIAGGHYGFNVGEASSPASSIAYPFLLAPFIAAGLGEAAPLLLNVVPLMVLTWQLHHWVEAELGAAPTASTALTLSVLACVDAVGLTFMGMETLLQLLISLAVCVGIHSLVRGGTPGPGWWIAVIAGPLVRYELLALSLAAVALWGWSTRRFAAAALCAIGTIAPLAVFSAWLVSRGLSWLPDSVLIKAGQYDAALNGNKVVAFVSTGLANLATAPGRLLLVLALTAVAGAVRWPARAAYAAIAVFILIAQVCAGQVGWFGRYEAWSLLALLLLAAGTWLTPERTSTAAHRRAMLIAVACVGVLALPGLRTAYQTPYAAHSFYAQQFQMSRIVRQLGVSAFAVGDIGLVKWRNPQVQVVDIVGLASHDVALQRRCCGVTDRWLTTVALPRRAVSLVMMYRDERARDADGWTRLGVLAYHGTTARLGGTAVTLYATGDADAEVMTRELASMSFPGDVRLDVDDERSRLSPGGVRPAVHGTPAPF